MNPKTEIRIHGRGGQGVAVMAEMLATAFLLEKKYATSFPLFGSERRGGPVTAFARFASMPILEKTQIYEPSLLILFDPALLSQANVFHGLRRDSSILVNSALIEEKLHPNVNLVGFVDANKIAIKKMGKALPNTCLLGAFASLTCWLSLDSVLECLTQYFSGKTLLLNQECARIGFKEVKVLKV